MSLFAFLYNIMCGGEERFFWCEEPLDAGMKGKKRENHWFFL